MLAAVIITLLVLVLLTVSRALSCRALLHVVGGISGFFLAFLCIGLAAMAEDPAIYLAVAGGGAVTGIYELLRCLLPGRAKSQSVGLHHLR